MRTHHVPMRALTLLATLVLLAPSASSQASTPDLFVTSRFTDEVLRYDGDTGTFLGVFASGGGLSNPVGLTFGPDGHLYVASANNNRVLRYHGTTGAFLRIFASGNAIAGTRNLNFGPDGHLYVASGSANRIVRYNGQTGTWMGTFTQGGNLQGPTSFTFGPDGDLYVGSVLNDLVLRYDGKTGAFLGNFITTNVDGPHDVAFGPDGRFYVTSANRRLVQVFDPVTGVFVENLLFDPALSFPLGIQWNGAGHLYIANQGRNDVRRYDTVTGALDRVVVPPGRGGLSGPLFLAFEPSGGPRVEDTVPSMAGVPNYVRISGFEPGRRAYLLFGTPITPVPVTPCGLELGLAAPMVLHVMSLDESGSGVLGGFVPLSLAGVTLNLQATAPTSCEFTAVKSVTF